MNKKQFRGVAGPRAKFEVGTDASGKCDPGAGQPAVEKLPMLGPALWLYARDANRKFNFFGDMDWLLLPPVMLDQCRLYTRKRVPFAFFTWARVSDAVDQRLRSGIARLAPQEWNTGPHVWLTDAVAPFGGGDEMTAELLKREFPGCRVKALYPDPDGRGALAVHELSSVPGA